jgi:hypothetical protein
LFIDETSKPIGALVSKERNDALNHPAWLQDGSTDLVRYAVNNLRLRLKIVFPPRKFGLNSRPPGILAFKRRRAQVINCCDGPRGRDDRVRLEKSIEGLSR